VILSHDFADLWHAWITVLTHLSGIHIPRWMETSNGHDTQTHFSVTRPK
jgi:hypothetical protein